MSIQFPKDPITGQIYEAAPGVTYRYSAVTRSWVQIVRPQLPLATDASAGLMSAADFRKIAGFILPPPQTTIRAEDCTVDPRCASKISDRIESGYISFEGDGIINFEVLPDNIHDNTGLINVSLDVDHLIELLRSTGRLTMVAPTGDDGPKGDPGDPGLDSLPVGPYGDDGEPGKPAEWRGGLVEEGLNIKDDNRAIVDIKTEQISPDENYLIVTRANIGNPDACPNTIKPKDVQSPWLLAMTSGTTSVVRRRTSDNKLICSRSCSSNIYYLNIEHIIRNIRRQFIHYLNYIKQRKELYVTDVLQDMINAFDGQKTALGCALEACRSRSRNADARRYIEQSKIAAAAAGYNIEMSGRGAGYTPMFYHACDYNVISLHDPEQAIINPEIFEQHLTGIAPLVPPIIAHGFE